MYTFVEVEIVNHLKSGKEDIVKEMIQPFQKISVNNIRERLLQKELSVLMDAFLLKISTEKKPDFSKYGKEVENHRNTLNLSVKGLLDCFEETRLVLERWIISSPCSSEGKSYAIAQLNEFFLELQKETYLQTTKKKNEEIKSKNVQLSELKRDRMKILSQLSTSLAHEIRNPLTSIKGFIQLLEKRIDPPAQEKKYFEYIYHEMKELEQEVNQILFLSNEKNHQDIQLTNICLNDLIYDAIKSFQPILTQNKIVLELNFIAEQNIVGIEEQIKLVLLKLLQNANDALILKDKNRKLSISLLEKENDIIITVSNNGPPIPSIIRHSIFEPFVGTKELGKGLGLTVSKQLMKKHQGAIEHYSEGEWTTFILRFPTQ